jgi:2-(3-amino-3-carboxypropyl)histidine synthase
MEKLFIEARYKGKIKIDKKDIAQLPKKLGLATTVQFLDNIKEIKEQLKGKTIILDKEKQTYEGQILGCDTSGAEKIKNKVDAFLYVGTGHFHPIAMGLLEKSVYLLNPMTGKITKLKEEIIQNYQKRKKGAMLKFLNGKNIGIIVSTKQGQHYPIKQLSILKTKYPKKQFYIFVADMIDINQFNNFSFIDAWINTACPRIEEDYILLNIRDLN